MHHSPWSSPSVTPYANRFCGKEFLARAHNSTHWERNPSRNQIWLCFSSSGLHNGLHSRMRIPILPKVWHRFRFRAPRAPRRKVEVKVAAFGFARMRFFFLSLSSIHLADRILTDVSENAYGRLRTNYPFSHTILQIRNGTLRWLDPASKSTHEDGRPTISLQIALSSK